MSNSEDNLGNVNRRKAKSGNLSYSDPIVLHSSSKKTITFVPFFIQHSDRTELSVKIVSKKIKPGELSPIFRQNST